MTDLTNDTSKQNLLAVADRACAAAELAENRIEAPHELEHLDEAVTMKFYAEGVEDALRWLAGATAPTDALAQVLRANGEPREARVTYTFVVDVQPDETTEQAVEAYLSNHGLPSEFTEEPA